MKSFLRGSSLALIAGLTACGGGSSHDAAKNLATNIPVTRAACTPFGDPPRPVQSLPNALFNPTCRGEGGRTLDPWTDADGNARQACLYEPPQAAADHKLPLVVWLHPSVAGTDWSLNILISNVRQQIATANLTDDPQRPGFIVLAPYGRVTPRFYPFPDQGFSPGWDNWYRQLQPDQAARSVNGASWPENVDAASIDHFLADVLAQGKVDASRIYIMGWSNGSAMATLYSLNRPQFAAAAIYSSPDPFQAFNDPCPQAPVTGDPKDDTQVQLLAPRLPMYQVHNDCDIAGLCPNSRFLAQTLHDGGVADMQLQTIDTLQHSTDHCLDICGTDPTIASGLSQSPAGDILGTANHFRWPRDWTDDMFTFLREHPH